MEETIIDTYGNKVIVITRDNKSCGWPKEVGYWYLGKGGRPLWYHLSIGSCLD